MNDDDVKHLLGRAFGEEPPLGIDRDEVLRDGRKRLRRRRLFASGGVVAAVVVVAIGAATLPNLVDDSTPERMPPAATGTSLPESSFPPPPPSIRTQAPLTPDWAAKLTSKLYGSGYLPESAVQPVAGEVEFPKFQVVEDKYVYRAKIIGPSGEGVLKITVESSRGIKPDCASITRQHQYSSCEIHPKDGVDLLVARERWSDRAEVITYAQAVLNDGTLVTAKVSNVVIPSTSNGTTPTPLLPVLDGIVVKSGLSVR
ncbi:hypothetical protein [Actinophytocola sp.]|uniref:hypothetical protein n=1 Tax=Actinophytocola sp. TaxID=1872138 RepID=UPI002ED16946